MDREINLERIMICARQMLVAPKIYKICVCISHDPNPCFGKTDCIGT